MRKFVGTLGNLKEEGILSDGNDQKEILLALVKGSVLNLGVGFLPPIQTDLMFFGLKAN